MPGWFALLLALPASAGEPDPKPASERVTTSITEDFELRYHMLDARLADPSDVPIFNYVEQVNRLNLHVSRKGLAFEAQIDQVSLLANKYYLNDILRVERHLLDSRVWTPLSDQFYVNPEKLRLRVERPNATWIVGDSYAAFGRGIALNLNRNVDIDVDTSIQGVKATLRPGAWDVTVVAGQLNRQQVFQDNPNIEIAPDLRHGVMGVRAERFGLGPANIGAHVVAYDFVTQPGFSSFGELGGLPDAVIGGATLELSGVAGVDWYAEADVFSFPTDALPSTLPDAEDQLGYAGYLSAALYPGRTVWLVEAKRYYQADRPNSLLTPELYEVAVAPTLEYERAITEDSSASVNSNDIWGGRVRVDYAMKPGELVPYLSGAVFRDNELGGLHFNASPETIFHGVAGVEIIRDQGAALINAGYRVDWRDDRSQGADRQIHGDASVKFPIGLGLHAEVQGAVEHFRWGENPLQQQDYVEIESGLTIQRGSRLAFTWYTDFTSNPLVDSTGNLGDDLYGAAEVLFKPSDAVTLKAFYGAYKAGIRCSGGQCRQLPGFEGARFSFVGTF